MKTRVNTLLGVLCAVSASVVQPASAAREIIGAPVTEKIATVEVTEQTRIWRMQADSEGAITFFVERVRTAADQVIARETIATITRDITAAHADTVRIAGQEITLKQWLSIGEKFARKWYAEDKAAAAAAAQPLAPGP